MAGQHHETTTTVDDGTVPQVDFEAHQRTFDAFIDLTKWAIIAVVLLLIGMAWFLL